MVTLTQMDPCPGFTPSMGLLLEFMSRILSMPSLYACFLSTAGAIASRYAGSDMQLPDEFINGVMWRAVSFCTSLQVCTENPDIVASFCSYLNVLVEYYPANLVALAENSWAPLIVDCLVIQERFALKALLAFIARLVGSEPACRGVAVDMLGQKVLKHVIAGIGGGAALSLVVDYTLVLYRFVPRLMDRYCVCYPRETGVICEGLLSVSGFPSANVGADEKRGFMVEALGTQQYSKFKDVVKRFSGKCRGHSL
jgi:hypothetical protein